MGSQCVGRCGLKATGVKLLVMQRKAILRRFELTGWDEVSKRSQYH
ncbi:hypothetical protein [Nostoc sp. 106C]|nr:hypothetical protein [Nostoc sp. 106C]